MSSMLFLSSLLIYFKKNKHSWVQNPAMVQLLHKIQKGEANSKYTWHNNQLRRKDKLMVGANARLRLKLLNYLLRSP